MKESHTRFPDDDPFSFEDGRTFNEKGNVESVDQENALQPGDVITVYDPDHDLRVIEVSQDGVLAIKQKYGVVEGSARAELVSWSDVRMWTNREEVERTDALWDEFMKHDIRPKTGKDGSGGGSP